MARLINIFFIFCLISGLISVASANVEKPETLPDTAWSKIRNKIEISQQNILRDAKKNIYKAINIANDMQIQFHQNDIRITPTDLSKSPWYVNFTLKGLGYKGRVNPLPQAKLVASNNKIEYQRGLITEWYINDKRGLEQGFTIKEPPNHGNSGLLIVEISGKSSLKPILKGKNSNLSFVNAEETPLLNYGKLYTFDATGKALPTWLRIQSIDTENNEFQLALVVDDKGAKYPITVDPLIATQLTKFNADDSVEHDRFGYSIALYADTLIVGAVRKEDREEGSIRIESGFAYIFERDPNDANNWIQVKKITTNRNPINLEAFGSSVAIHEDTAFIGAPGTYQVDTPSVYVYERNQGGINNWGEVKVIKPQDPASDSGFGYSLAIDQNTLIVGSDIFSNVFSDGTSFAYIFERNQGGFNSWSQVKKITVNNGAPFDGFGRSVAIEGDKIAVGAPRAREVEYQAGAVYIFYRDQGGLNNWGQIKKIIADDASPYAWLGASIDFDNETLVVGTDNISGSVYIFEQHAGGTDNWGQANKLIPNENEISSSFGASVAIQNDTLLVGAPSRFSQFNEASAYVYKRNEGGLGNWGEVTKIKPTDSAQRNNFGQSVAFDSSTVFVIGAHGINDDMKDEHDDLSFLVPGMGAAYIFALEQDDSNAPYPFTDISGLGLRAIIETEEKGDIDAVWSQGGEAITDRGDKVIWGYFYAKPEDVGWGDPQNPEVFVKIWFDYRGRIDVNYFHTSVPRIRVATASSSSVHLPEITGITTVARRYIRHIFYPNESRGSDDKFENGKPNGTTILLPEPIDTQIANGLYIGSTIKTLEKGVVDAVWQQGGQSVTERGDQVIWGYFSADPNDVTWGNPNNPESFVKIWFDQNGRVDVNYFHVSVPPIGVYSGFQNNQVYEQSGTTFTTDRYIRHEFYP